MAEFVSPSSKLLELVNRVVVIVGGATTRCQYLQTRELECSPTNSRTSCKRAFFKSLINRPLRLSTLVTILIKKKEEEALGGSRLKSN